MNHFCGIRLSTFSVVIGWINLIGAVFSTILLCVAFVYLDDVVKAVQTHYNDAAADGDGVKTSVIITLCFYLTTSVANVIASALLIVGTLKERHLLLAPWLINTYIVIFYNVINFMYVIYMAFAKDLDAGVIFAQILITGISLAIQCTIWNAIYAHFKQLRANHDMQQRLLPTTAASQYSCYTKMPTTLQ